MSRDSAQVWHESPVRRPDQAAGMASVASILVALRYTNRNTADGWTGGLTFAASLVSCSCSTLPFRARKWTCRGSMQHTSLAKRRGSAARWRGTWRPNRRPLM